MEKDGASETPGKDRRETPIAAEVGLLVGGAFIAGLACTVIFGFLLFHAGLAVNGHAVWFGVAAAALFVVAGATRVSGNVTRRAGLAVTALLLAALLAAAVFTVQTSFYDFCIDGLAYHADGTRALADGWNPVRDEPVENLWVNSYPKGTWVLAATLYEATGDIEKAKVGNLCWTIGAFGIAIFTLAGVLRRNLALSIGIALLLAANPVAMRQAFSQYIDGQVAGALLAVACLTVAIRRHGFGDRRVTILWALAILAGINIKFTASLYIALVLFLGMVVPRVSIVDGRSLFTRGLRRTPLLRYIYVSLAALLAAAILGFNPFVTNLQRHGRVDYPPKESFLDRIRPPEFKEMNRFEQFARSTLSITTRQPPEAKWPFTLRGSEWEEAGYCWFEVGGFGPLWSGCLVLTALILALSHRRRGSFLKACIFIGCVLLTVLSTTEGYCARQAPQFWWVAAAGIALAFAPRSGRGPRVTGAVLAAFLLLNLCMMSAARLPAQAARTRIVKRALARVEAYQRSTGNEVCLVRGYMVRNDSWLEDRGIRFFTAPTVDEGPPGERIDLEAAFATVILP